MYIFLAEFGVFTLYFEAILKHITKFDLYFERLQVSKNHLKSFTE